MATPALSERTLVGGRLDDSSRWERPTASRSGRRFSPNQRVLLGMAVAGLAVGLFLTWYFARSPGLAAAAGLLTLGAALKLRRAQAEMSRNQRELERLVASLRRTDPVDVADFGLGPDWQHLAQRLIDTHSTLVRQARERQASTQKSELTQRLAEAAQRRAEAVVNSLGDAVLVTNSFGELVLANAEAERLFQWDLDRVRGKPARDVLTHPALVKWIDRTLQNTGEARRHTEELSLAVNGKTHWYKVTAAAVVDHGTEPSGLVTVLRDTTSEKAAQARSAEFVSAVSHEIKTPLASVKAYAEMLADGDADGDPETQQKFLSIIEEQTDRMSRMLESMLDLARVESGVIRAEKKLLSLNELVENNAKLMQPSAAGKNISVELRLSSLYLAVEIDPDMMSRVVINLISNAIKYTDAGGRIVLRSQLQQDRARFEVEDTGRGIPPEAMAQLFKKFYRVKENAGMAHGTGLGLSLVKHIVEEMHGGKIEVESQVGKGSIFRVELPLPGSQQG